MFGEDEGPVGAVSRKIIGLVDFILRGAGPEIVVDVAVGECFPYGLEDGAEAAFNKAVLLGGMGGRRCDGGSQFLKSRQDVRGLYISGVA